MKPSLYCLLTGDRNKASSYYRIYAAEPYLSQDYESAFLRLGSKPWNRWPSLLRVKAGSRVLLQKDMLGDVEWRHLRNKAGRLVFDVDDSIWHGMDAKTLRIFERTLEESDAVICSIDYVAERCAKHNSNILLSPSPVDPAHYQALGEPDSHDGGIVLGWSGSSSGYAFFDTIADELEAALKAHPELKLRMLSSRPTRPKDGRAFELEQEFRPFQRESYLAEMSRFHMGLMPLIDSNWSRGKCGYKLMQYQMTGVWPLAADVGYNCSVIHSPEMGALYNSAVEFRSQLENSLDRWDQIVAGRAERRRVVEERFGMHRHMDVLRSALKG